METIYKYLEKYTPLFLRMAIGAAGALLLTIQKNNRFSLN